LTPGERKPDPEHTIHSPQSRTVAISAQNQELMP
jgi:hypothetical protein